MTKSGKIQERMLAELEAEFKPLLLACLQRSVLGKYGLFGQNDHLHQLPKPLQWPEAMRVIQLALEIQDIHRKFGSSNPICEAFMNQRALSKLHQSNTLGEPKLAAHLLNEIYAFDLLDAHAPSANARADSRSLVTDSAEQDSE